MFLSISKNACSSLKSLIYRIDYGEDFVMKNNSGIHEFWGFQAKKDRIIDVRDKKELANYPDYIKFVVYRDPVDRFVSVYHNKVIDSPKPHVFYVTHKLEGLSFEAFLDKSKDILDVKDPLHIDEHMRPQSNYFKPTDVDYIVRLEDLNAFLKEKFNIERTPHENKVTAEKTIPTAAQVNHIKRLYRKDYAIIPNYRAAV